MQSDYRRKWLEQHAQADWICLRRESGLTPLVSVVIPTYQHVAFIDRCVASVLAQRTDFDVEIIIGEDGSTDGTRERVEELQRQHPDQITALFQPRENNFTIDGRPTSRFNLLACFAEARGKYIAWCDGDDYFIDDEKLAAQCARLEAEPEIIGVWTEFVSQESITFWKPSGLKEVFGSEGVWPVNKLCTSSTMIRREALDCIDGPVMSDAEFFDIALWIRLFKVEGFKGGFIHSPMVNYTQHGESAMHSMGMERQLRKLLQIQVQLLSGQLMDSKDFHEIIESYDARLQRFRRTRRWGVRHVLRWRLVRRLLSWWKSR